MFRGRLLHGRGELIRRLPVAAGDVVVELGCGTGENLERFGGRLARMRRLTLVDLCPALLAQARVRAARQPNVEVVEADITRSMVEDWRAAIDNAVSMLGAGGTLGVVDFYVSAARPPAGRSRHAAWERWLWRRWFAHDGVRLDPDHLAHLETVMPDCRTFEGRGGVPYLPGLTVPYYVFIGHKR